MLYRYRSLVRKTHKRYVTLVFKKLGIQNEKSMNKYATKNISNILLFVWIGKKLKYLNLF